jgi:ATP-dependent protease HslVU (ClpYQ) peptidase subunit
MSLILGAVNDKKMVIGADSGGILSSFDYEIRKDSKLFVKNDEMIFGFAGSFRVGQLVNYQVEFEKKKSNAISDHEYLCSTVVEAIRYYVPDLDDTNFLIAYNGNIYTIQTDYQVSSIRNDFDAIGSGSPYAVSGYHFFNKYSEMEIEEKIQKSLEFTTKFNLGAQPPFEYISLEYNN